MLNNKLLFHLILLFFGITAPSIFGQNLDFSKGKTYVLDSISVSGLKTFNDQTVISFSGLRKGQNVSIPGEEISAVINKLWGLDLFSDINFYVTNVQGNNISLEIEIEELPTLTDVKVVGLKKGKTEAIIKDTELTVGKKLSESFVTNTKNYILNKMKKEGFYNAKVNLNQILDSTEKNGYKMVVNVDRGSRIKIGSINFEGNEIYTDQKLRQRLKKTRQKNSLRLWKKAKYIEEDYNADLEKLMDFYKANGFRDARIIQDSIGLQENMSLAAYLEI